MRQVSKDRRTNCTEDEIINKTERKILLHNIESSIHLPSHPTPSIILL